MTDRETTLTPTEDLLIEVLAARHRTGETMWTFATTHTRTVRTLAEKGLVSWKSGVVENTLSVWLTDDGRDYALDEEYTPPMSRETALGALTTADERERAWLNADPRKAAENLLAVVGAGEQPGPRKAGVMALTGMSSDEVDALGGVREDDDPAPVVPDSAGLRERVRRVVKRAATWTEDGPEYEVAPDAGMVEKITDAVLAVVGQGVTAADCNCGFGGQHDPANPRCRANRDAEERANDDH